MDRCYYEILEVSKNATKDELLKKKRELSRKYHPDKLPHEKKEEGTEMLKQINEAYDILNDDNKRETYDRFGKEGLNGHGPNPFNFDPSEMFPQHNHNNIQIRPIEINITITLEEVFSGKDILETTKRYSPCNDCESTGFEDKKTHNCDKCNGSGKTMEKIQMGHQIFMQQSRCHKCKGTGNFGNNIKKCKKCSGEKVILEKHQIKYKLEKGIMKDNVINISGEGHHAMINGKPKRGDIALIINIKEHSVFKITNKYNLSMDIELTLVESLCGIVKSFKFLDGNTKYIDITSPIRNGDKKMLSECGLPHMNSTYKVGDLHITFVVKFPDIIETGECKKSIYLALVGNVDDYDKLHDVPDNQNVIELQDINMDNHSGNTEDSDDEQHEHQRGGPQGVQCAQQ